LIAFRHIIDPLVVIFSIIIFYSKWCLGFVEIETKFEPV